MKSGQKPRVMPLPQALETAALLSRHLRTYTPIIAAIGSGNRKAVRQELLVRLATQLLEDEPARKDLLQAMSNLLGEEVKILELGALAPALRAAWKANKMQDVMGLCYQCGILDKQDLANVHWVIANWSVKHAS